jgi:uncharacterized membrane protein
VSLDVTTLIVIIGMGLITYATRISGYFLLRRRSFGPRISAAMEAVPPAVLTAVIAPAVLAAGPAEAVAGAITALAALRLPFIAVIIIGTASVVLLRLAGL